MRMLPYLLIFVFLSCKGRTHAELSEDSATNFSKKSETIYAVVLRLQNDSALKQYLDYVFEGRFTGKKPPEERVEVPQELTSNELYYARMIFKRRDQLRLRFCSKLEQAFPTAKDTKELSELCEHAMDGKLETRISAWVNLLKDQKLSKYDLNTKLTVLNDSLRKLGESMRIKDNEYISKLPIELIAPVAPFDTDKNGWPSSHFRVNAGRNVDQIIKAEYFLLLDQVTSLMDESKIRNEANKAFRSKVLDGLSQ